jgi:hypothetical protein
MSGMAAAEIQDFQSLAARLADLGADPETAMEPFVAALETYHALTEPSTWLEGVVKAYVGDGMAADFYREVAAFVDPETKGLIDSVLSDAGRAEFAVREVRSALAASPEQAGRLALWARRLVGEALAQAHRVAAQRPALAHLLTAAGKAEGSGQGNIGRMFARLTDAHDRRMAELGLAG